MLSTLLEQVGDSFVLEEVLYRLEQEFERAEEDETYYKRLVELSQHYRKMGAVDIALALLTKLYQIAPRNKVIFLLAQLHYDLTNYMQAGEWLALLPTPLTAYKPLILQSKVLIALEDYSQAKQLLKSLIEKYPTESLAYKLLAEVYESQALYDQAEHYYRILYEYFGTQIDVDTIRFKLIELAIFHKEVLNMHEIATLFPEEVDNADEAYLLALAYQKAENFTEAIVYAQLAVELATDFIDGHFLLLELYSQSEDWVHVHQELDWLTQVIPPYDAMIVDLVPFALASHYEELALCDKVIDYYPLCEDLDERYQLLEYVIDTYLCTKTPAETQSLLEQLDDGDFEPTELDKLYRKINKAQ